MKEIERIRKAFFVEPALADSTIKDKLILPFVVFFSSEYLSKEKKAKEIEDSFNNLFRNVTIYNAMLSQSMRASTSAIQSFLLKTRKEEAQVEFRIEEQSHETKVPILKLYAKRLLVAIKTSGVLPSHLSTAKVQTKSSRKEIMISREGRGSIELETSTFADTLRIELGNESQEIQIRTLIPNVIFQTSFKVNASIDAEVAVMLGSKDAGSVTNLQCELDDEGNSKKYITFFLENQYTVK